MVKITRRNFLALGGAAAVGVTVGAVGAGAAISGRTGAGQPVRQSPVTFDSWLRTRRAPYAIAHRGVGDVAPEHTLPSYQMALDYGASCLEISVVMSADKVLYCLHDLTLDRTTTLTGAVRSRTSAELDQARVRVPRLGPKWAGANMPAIPRLQAALEAVRGRAVLCLEPKDDAAYPQLISSVKDAGLADAMMLKVDASSPRLKTAKDAGYPVFAYLGNVQAATPAAIRTLATRLDPDRDALVLPARAGTTAFPADLVRRAVGTGVPVWVFPVHRRSEARQFALLGAEGLITPSIGYLTGSLRPQTADDWASGGMSSGEMTRDPYSDAYALDWDDEAAVGLGFAQTQAFLTLGQFSPITSTSYRIAFDMAFDPLPRDSWQHVSVAFGHADDRYYEHRLGDSDGYHVLLRGDGSMAIYAHVKGDPNGQVLAQGRSGTPLKPGLWSHLTLDVTPELIRWSRDDGTTLQASDGRFRGGYLHIGRSSADGRLNLRNLSVG